MSRYVLKSDRGVEAVQYDSGLVFDEYPDRLIKAMRDKRVQVCENGTIRIVSNNLYTIEPTDFIIYNPRTQRIHVLPEYQFKERYEQI